MRFEIIKKTFFIRHPTVKCGLIYGRFVLTLLEI